MHSVYPDPADRNILEVLEVCEVFELPTALSSLRNACFATLPNAADPYCSGAAVASPAGVQDPPPPATHGKRVVKLTPTPSLYIKYICSVLKGFPFSRLSQKVSRSARLPPAPSGLGPFLDPQDRPRGGQDSSRTTQGHAKRPQDRAKTAKIAPDRSYRGSPDPFQTPQDRSKKP